MMVLVRGTMGMCAIGRGVDGILGGIENEDNATMGASVGEGTEGVGGRNTCP